MAPGLGQGATAMNQSSMLAIPGAANDLNISNLSNRSGKSKGSYLSLDKKTSMGGKSNLRAQNDDTRLRDFT